MNKLFLTSIILFSVIFDIRAQITVDNAAPYDSEVFLIDNILLGNGVAATNHSFQGDPIQIGYFDGSNSNIGLPSGIVMATGDINLLDPNFVGFGGAPAGGVTDPDLLDVANSVPGQIGQNFVVNSVNDVAILEFDFIPNSSFLSFNFVFGSQEYNAWENSTFNDVFAFFISGPGITGPYASPAGFPDGSINIATFESQEANSLGLQLPITISSVHSGYNAQFYVDNVALTTVDDADGFTIVMTAESEVICGETYHIRLAIADGSDTGLSSYIFLEEGSFMTTSAEITNNMNIFNDTIYIDCDEEVTFGVDICGDYDYEWSNGSTLDSITVTEGIYYVQATNVNNPLNIVNSDTLVVILNETISDIDLGPDQTVCGTDSTLIQVQGLVGTPPYIYNWSNGAFSSSINVPHGVYSVTVTDANECEAQGTVEIFSNPRPTASISGGGIICSGSTDGIPLQFIFTGTPPFNYSFENGSQVFNETSAFTTSLSNYEQAGTYSLLSVEDANCTGTFFGSATIDYFDTPTASISGGEVICPYDSTLLKITANAAIPYAVSLNNGSFNTYFNSLTDDNLSVYVSDTGSYFVSSIIDANGCVNYFNDGQAVVRYKPVMNPFITSSINEELCPVDDPVQLYTLEENGIWSGKGMNLNGVFDPIIAGVGDHVVKYSYPQNCNESDSIIIEVGCEMQFFAPNSFTPNGDGENELFVIKGNNIIDYEINIYNRWGELLFNSKDINISWDGKYNNQVVPEGSYFYTIDIYGKDAQIFSKPLSVNVLE